MGKKRIFWFGAHKVLKRTELRQLRQLGFEVFNPAYITPLYDQSADLRKDIDQPTTLPPDVFAELMQHDFFYTQIPPRISELLNEFFETAIVTISYIWLNSLLAGFRGPVIYRVYGQPFSLSEKLIEAGLWEQLVTRKNFSIVPFAWESVEHEHRWFLELCTDVVPYQIPIDVFDRSGSWTAQAHRKEVATSIPNIQDPYYAAAYADFASEYPHRIFRIYGPQRAAPPDSRIVGALEREVLLDRLANSSGFLYNYKDDVCYLPPIETMEIGGPVIYAPGSLLSRFYDGATPGLILDKVDAEKKISWLLSGDATFIKEIITCQDSVRRRYDRSIVQPIFDDVFRRLLNEPASVRPALRYTPPIVSWAGAAVNVETNRSSIYVLLHVDGLFQHRKGKPYAFEGIPRVFDIVVDALVRFSEYDVVVTCTTQSLEVMHDFFQPHLKKERLRLHVVNCGATVEESQRDSQRLSLIEDINGRIDVACVLVPHYYLFPEALLLTTPIALYLPDYFPHIMPGVVFESPEKDQENKEVGVAIARKSSFILTNSEFTRNYLPEAGFVTPEEACKVIVAPLPLLGAKRVKTITVQEERTLRDRLAGRRFILYPTANRPNKQIAFLLRVFALARLTHPDLALVLTCDLNSVPVVAQTTHQYELNEDLVLLNRIDEGSLRWLYEHSAALCLTSTLEGNFPPQILEALSYGAPVVATRLAPITEKLGDLAAELLLCNPLDIQDFCAKLSIALLHRDEIVNRQNTLMKSLRERNTPEAFYAPLARALKRLKQKAA